MTQNYFEVQDVLDIYKIAIYERDVEKFLSIYAPEIHNYDCWGNWEYEGISTWEKNVVEWFKGLKDESILLLVDFKELVIEESSNIAFVHCAVNYTAHHEETGERLRQMTNRFTYGLKKVNDSWMIVHEHSSLPINMETGKGIFNLK